MKQVNDIVADGQKRIQAGEAYHHQEREIRATIAAKYDAELARARWFDRWWISYKMEREIDCELQKLAPDQGLYLVAQK